MNPTCNAPIATIWSDTHVPGVAEWQRVLLSWTIRAVNPIGFEKIIFSILQDGSNRWLVATHRDGACTEAKPFTSKEEAYDYYALLVHTMTPDWKQGSLFPAAHPKYLTTYVYRGFDGGPNCEQSHAYTGES